MKSPATYVLRITFEWGGGCLFWPGNDAAHRGFGAGPYGTVDSCPLPLSPAILERCTELAAWHDSSLNREYPPDPGPWRQAECDRFNAAVSRLLADLNEELGPGFEVINRQAELTEDPELDAYLADPAEFRRRDQQAGR